MTRTSWERVDVLFRFLVTGIKALVFGLAFWYVLLAANAFLFLGQISRDKHHSAFWSFSFFRSELGLGLVYGGAFFVSAMLAAHSRRSCFPAVAAFMAYALFAVIILPDPSPPSESDFWCFLAPLLTAPAGGWFGERVFRRLHR